MQVWRRVLRTKVALGCALFLSACGFAVDQPDASMNPNDWRDQYPTVRVAQVLPPELSDPNARRVDLASELSDRLDVPVEVKQLNGYGPTIEALTADQIDMGTVGAGALAGIHDIIGEDTLPVGIIRSFRGETGYYSGLLVAADSPYRTLQDLKGKRIGYVDLNSTSGYIYPRAQMRKEGIEPDTFFGESGVSGGGVPGMIGLSSGQFDGIFFYSSFDSSEEALATGYMKILVDRGLIEAGQYRFIWFAGPIPSSSLVMRGDKNPGFQDLLIGVANALPYEAPEVLISLGLPNRGSSFESVDLEVFREIIDLRQAEIESTSGTQGEAP